MIFGSVYQSNERKKLVAIKEPLIDIINKYEEYFNDEENDDDVNDDNATIGSIEYRITINYQNVIRWKELRGVNQKEDIAQYIVT